MPSSEEEVLEYLKEMKVSLEYCEREPSGSLNISEWYHFFSELKKIGSNKNNWVGANYFVTIVQMIFYLFTYVGNVISHSYDFWMLSYTIVRMVFPNTKHKGIHSSFPQMHCWCHFCI